MSDSSNRLGTAILGAAQTIPAVRDPGTHTRVIMPEGLARPTLTGGITAVQTRVFLSDPHNRRGDEITHRVHAASLTYDSDRRIQSHQEGVIT